MAETAESTPAGFREPRTKIIGGTLYQSSTVPYAYVASCHVLGNGQVEALISPKYSWHEHSPLSPLALADYDQCILNPVQRTPYEQEQEDIRNRVRATRRARTKVRRLCKHRGLIEILTLTYRENMQDRERMARDLDVFIKRIRRVIPAFQYVAVFEKQKRGAWHAHLAVERVLPVYWKNKTLVKSFDLLRSMWRGVVGVDNGNIDVSKRHRRRWSPAKIAGYISKYIGKNFGENLKYENSYSASGAPLPKPIRFTFPTLFEGISGVFALLTVELRGAEIFTKLLPGSGFWLSAAPRPK